MRTIKIFAWVGPADTKSVTGELLEIELPDYISLDSESERKFISVHVDEWKAKKINSGWEYYQNTNIQHLSKLNIPF